MDNNRFKRAFIGGFDRKDVVNAFSAVSNSYEAHLEQFNAQLKSAQEGRSILERSNSILVAKVTELESVNSELRRQVGSLEAMVLKFSNANYEIMRAASRFYNFDSDPNIPKPGVSALDSAILRDILDGTIKSEALSSFEAQTTPEADIERKTDTPYNEPKAGIGHEPVVGDAERAVNAIDFTTDNDREIKRIEELLKSIKPVYSKEGAK